MHAPRYRQELTVAVAASAVTVVLTGIAFWLSYEHLAEVAAGNGLPGVRGWAWPSTVDLFIVLGELLVLRASLQQRKDFFAYAITASGSLGSIALNVAGVGGDASTLEYVVAAVPPVAALLAFAALMRQVHEALRHQVVLQPPVTVRQEPLQVPVVDLEVVEETVETPVEELEAAGEPQVSGLEEQTVVETVTQEALIELLVAGGEPLPGRKTVADQYGVTDWIARQALKEAKARLQEADQNTTVAKEN